MITLQINGTGNRNQVLQLAHFDDELRWHSGIAALVTGKTIGYSIEEKLRD